MRRSRLALTSLALLAVPALATTAGQYDAAPKYQPEVEPNDSAATATVLGLSTTLAIGTLLPGTDNDYWSFFALQGQVLHAAVVTSGSATAGSNSRLAIVGTDGVTLLETDENDGSSNDVSSSIAGFTIPTTGTYSLLVWSTDIERRISPYELYVVLHTGAPVAESEPNHGLENAQPLPTFGWVSGTRDPASATEQDIFRFTALPGDTVFLSLDLDPERDLVQWDGRLLLGLFGDDANLGIEANNVGVSLGERASEALVVTIRDGGTYYAVVDSASAAIGGPTATYRLSVALFGEIDEGTSCAFYWSSDVTKTLGPGPSLTSSTLTVPGHPRIADLDVWIELDHDSPQDLDVNLRSPAGNENGLFSDIGAFANQYVMGLTFDDEAAAPSESPLTTSLTVKPDPPHRLAWFDGEDAGGVWTLDLYDDFAPGEGVLFDWGLRICQPFPTAPPPCPAQTTFRRFSTDFENGADEFVVLGGEWELGLPSLPKSTGTAAFTNCHSGTNCWKTDLDGTYANSTVHLLSSPEIDLAGWVGSFTLSWAQRFQLEAAWQDSYVVELTAPDGSSPKTIWQWQDGAMTSFPGSAEAAIGGSSGWSVVSRELYTLDLPGEQLRFRMRLTADSSGSYGGVAFDDLEIVGCDAGPLIFEHGFEPYDDEPWSATVP